MNPHRRALIELHICVVLWGFTAILGKLISLPALALVCWRMALVSVALLAFPSVRRYGFKLFFYAFVNMDGPSHGGVGRGLRTSPALSRAPPFCLIGQAQE